MRKPSSAAALHRQLQAAKNAGVHPLEPAERDGHAPRLQRLLERPECFLAGGFFLRDRCCRAGRFCEAALKSDVPDQFRGPPPREDKRSFRRRSRRASDHQREPARRPAGRVDRPSRPRPAIRPASPRENRHPATGGPAPRCRWRRLSPKALVREMRISGIGSRGIPSRTMIPSAESNAGEPSPSSPTGQPAAGG